MKTLVMTVYGLICDNAGDPILNNLALLHGVRQVRIDQQSCTARVWHDERTCKPTDLVHCVERMGFQVSGYQTVNAVQA